MRILYISSAIYDFLTASIIEGINALAKEMQLELVVTAHANYARLSQVWSHQKVLLHRNSFDLVILGTNIGVDVELFEELGLSDRAVCIDGSDSAELTYSPTGFRLYFKRELLETPHGNILPCPFAVENRWWMPLASNSRYLLAACFGATTKERAEVLAFLSSLGLSGIRTGPIPMNRWQKLAGVLRGQVGLSAFKTFRFGVGHNRPYYRILNRSMLALAIPGAGVDTGRRWEILGSGALLVAPRCRLQIPHPLIGEKHCLEYESLDDLRGKLEWASGHLDSIQRMRQEARRHCLAHHTSKERARYVIQASIEALRTSGPICRDKWTA